MPPTLFLLVFLPILLYGSGSSLDWHTFFRNVNPILTLAFPGVAIHTTLVAVIYKYVFPYGWSWKESFLFGSIISATDPVAVVRSPLCVLFLPFSSFLFLVLTANFVCLHFVCCFGPCGCGAPRPCGYTLHCFYSKVLVYR